ncbi:D-alanyl-D-alanine carboxypeptidase protein [Aurantimonas sp. 22II-16-19i]|nr:D-alanyl-D-alanine carboxypeptidase protein [Aurantimonas sp. 22II-16-19i]
MAADRAAVERPAGDRPAGDKDEFREKRVVQIPLFERLCRGAVVALAIAGLAAPLPAAAQAAADGVVVPTPKPSPGAAPAAGETASKAPADPARPAAAAAPAPAPASAPAPAESAATPAAEPEPPAETPPPYTMSSIVVDVATGKVLSEQDATERRFPASTTKLMTAYLALKALREGRRSLDSPVIVTRLAAAQAPAKMGYPAGSVIRLDNALKMMLVKSANDIAMAVGESLAHESEEDFVTLMNAEAARLGMRDTHFVNPNGLPGEGQYSTARDLALLALAIRREFPAFSGYFDIEAITNGKAIMKNGNKLLGRFEGADGMKTGYICASGFNLVSAATRNGRTIVAVVLGANGTIERERLSAAILQAGFETDPATKSERVEDLPPTPGEVVDISDYICGQAGRTARANERVEENDREAMFGSPYLTELKRPPVTVKVGLGGAAGNELVEAGVSIIANYGIPIPTPRPEPPAPDVADAAEDGADTVPAETMAGAPAAEAAPTSAPASAAEPAAPAAEQPRDKPSAANAYTGGAVTGGAAAAVTSPGGTTGGKTHTEGGARLEFPLGVRSPMAKRGPRLDSRMDPNMRPAGFGRQRPAAPTNSVN